MTIYSIIEGPAFLSFFPQMKTKVDSFKDHLPLVSLLFNPGLRDRHWDAMSDIVGYPLRPDEGSNLQKFVDMNLEPYLSKFDNISEAASKEYSLEKAMERMAGEWADVSMEKIIDLWLNLEKLIYENIDLYLLLLMEMVQCVNTIIFYCYQLGEQYLIVSGFHQRLYFGVDFC